MLLALTAHVRKISKATKPARMLQSSHLRVRRILAVDCRVRPCESKVVFSQRYTPMTDWFARPIINVTDVEAALRFYVNQLGFTNPWRYDEDGKVYVAQVDRQGCALILANSWPEKIGMGLMFISLNVEPATHEAAVAALDALRAELSARGVPVKEGSWGYRLLVIDDPDGNQLFFNYPSESASGRHEERPA